MNNFIKFLRKHFLLLVVCVILLITLILISYRFYTSHQTVHTVQNDTPMFISGTCDPEGSYFTRCEHFNVNSWFSGKDIVINNKVKLDNLHGYVLPHAGTTYTGGILSHTLQFEPSKDFDTIIIVFYPVHDKENIDNKYYHEYYVPYMSLNYVIKKYWKRNKKINFIGVNLRDNINLDKLNEGEISNNSLIILSVDFSHFLPLKEAIQLEDKASHSLMFRNLKGVDYNNIIDHKISFEYLYNKVPNNYQFQWIGRSRSPGEKGVGYLSFLLRDINKRHNAISGYYVTVYDENMNARECLGKYDNHTRNLDNFINEVIHKAKTTSRLTGGQYLNIPVTNYSITYLYKVQHKNFIRGYHAIRIINGALYLPDVFLENTHDNGIWIQPNHINWHHGEFDLNPTLKQLNKKGGTNKNEYILYATNVEHRTI